MGRAGRHRPDTVESLGTGEGRRVPLARFIALTFNCSLLQLPAWWVFALHLKIRVLPGFVKKLHNVQELL